MNTANLKIKGSPKQTYLKENTTHYAVKSADGKLINIFTKGVDIPEWRDDPQLKQFTQPEYLYSIHAENEDDLFAIFERFDEDNRVNEHEFREYLKSL